MTGYTINFKLIIKVLSFLLMIESGFMLLCLPFSLYYGGEDFQAIGISILITFFSGLIIWLSFRKYENKQLGKREGYIIVTFSWVVISIFGALPFVIHGAIPAYSNAFFETISGFTTTGATILTDIEVMPKGLLFWRSLTHWIGGMGIIVLTIAILPVFGIGGMQLYAAEMPGPTKDKIHPRIKETAKRLWGIYVILTFSETILLMFGGMNLFDALCHAFGTMATGGFSTKNTSIAGFSPYIQYVITIFMIIAGTNFTLHYLAIKKKYSKVFSNEEYKYYLFLIAAVTIVISVFLIIHDQYGIENSFRNALFQVVSIITTTGYITSDYLLWPGYLWFLIFLLMFTGGCAGSTGGGIKVIRQLLLIKNSSLELRRLIHPMAVIPVRLNKKPISSNIIFNVLAFFLIYMIIFALGSLIMSSMGLDYETAIGSVAATLGNIGPAIGKVGPVENYDGVPLMGKWFLSFLMLLGRLELFTVLILFTKAFWKR